MTKAKANRGTSGGLDWLKAGLVAGSLAGTLLGTRLLALRDSATLPPPPAATIVLPAADAGNAALNPAPSAGLLLDLPPVPQAVSPLLQPLARSRSSQ